MKGTGRLTPWFHGSVHEHCVKKKFPRERFDWNAVVRDSEGVDYQDLRAHAIISCQGAQMALGETDLLQQGLLLLKEKLYV